MLHNSLIISYLQDKKIREWKNLKKTPTNMKKKLFHNQLINSILWIKKLNLKPNQRVLDIGSGWGTLAIEIAKKSKCEVVGITLSENQLKYSKQKAKELNLENQVDFRLIDYRQLNEKFDRIVSVGMFEHVGRKFYQTYFFYVFIWIVSSVSTQNSRF